MDGVGHGSAVGLLRVLLVASVCVPVALFGLDASLSHRATFDDAAMDAARVSEVAREHAAKVFNSQELVARSAGDMLDGLDDTAAHGAEWRLHEALAGMIQALPQVGSLLILDAQARLLVATSAYPVSRTTDFSDRDYFLALRDGTAPQFLSEIHNSRLDGKAFFSLAHRLDTSDGRFRGLVSIAILPRFFVSFWTTLLGADAAARGKIVALLRDDGTILASGPTLVEAPATMGPTFLAASRNGPEAGVFADEAVLGGEAGRWRYTYRRVQGYPAYIVVGRSAAAVSQAWLQRMAAHLAVGIPATLVLVLVTWTALQRARREEVALAQMRAEMQRREVAEAALLQSQRLEVVGQLTGGVAHDFNNLLTIIMGNFEVIARTPATPEKTRRQAQAGLAAAQRGADLTAKLLAFSRHRLIRPEVVDVNRLLTEFRPVLRQGVTEAIELTFDLACDLQPASLDPGQLEAAVLNLVANARDAMRSGGTIRISTANAVISPAEAPQTRGLAPGAYVRVAVADDGPGMDPAVADRAFEPFFTTKAVGRGTGLGLSQVYGFCKRAGGLARIRSSPGHGTTVELLLPRATQPPRAPPARGVVTAIAAAGQMVLVVEDDEAVLEVAVATLRALGYATLSATDAAQALALLASDVAIDVLFSDVVLPGGMTGVQLSEKARQLRPGLRIVLASGYAGQEAERALPTEIVLLAKPYQRDELAAALGRR